MTPSQKWLTLDVMWIALLISTALAHEGHNHAPKGPYKVVKRERAWLECRAMNGNPPRRFASPFDKAIFHQIKGELNDTTILLGPGVKLKEGDILNAPILATEDCSHPFAMTCDERGRPNAPAYKGSLQDVYCAGLFNFVLARDEDRERGHD